MAGRQEQEGDLRFGSWNLEPVRTEVVAYLVFRELSNNPENLAARKLGAQRLSRQPFRQSLINTFLEGIGIEDLWVAIPTQQPASEKMMIVQTEAKEGSPLTWKIHITQ